MAFSEAKVVLNKCKSGNYDIITEKFVFKTNEFKTFFDRSDRLSKFNMALPSLDSNSPLVCQIPDCSTSQAEIEAELASFLSSFCSFCKKERAGKLCGCAFPCSLTFRAQMLNKIHELLGIEKPPDRRAIQVCFKHPDLLKQAREACVAKRDNESLAVKRRASTASSSAGTMSLAPSANLPALITTSKTLANNANILTQEPAKKMCKIQYNESLIENCEQDNEEFEDIMQSPRPDCSNKNSDVSFSVDKTSCQKSTFKSVNIKFRLQQDEKSQSEVEEEDDEGNFYNNRGELESVTNKTFRRDRDTTLNFRQHGGGNNVLKVQYKDYHQRILASSMRSLMHQSFLNDVKFVCMDNDVTGVVFANSLVLGSMSAFLRDVLADVPIVDLFKTVILPDVSALELETLLKYIFHEKSEVLHMTTREVKRIKRLATLFKLEHIMMLVRKPGRPKGSSSTKTKPVGTHSDPDQGVEEAVQDEVVANNDDNDGTSVSRRTESLANQRKRIPNLKYKDYASDPEEESEDDTVSEALEEQSVDQETSNSNEAEEVHKTRRRPDYMNVTAPTTSRSVLARSHITSSSSSSSLLGDQS